MRRQHRARRQGRANRPRRDIQRMASPSGVSSRNRPAGESESGTTLVDALSGASADAGSIPAASIKRRLQDFLEEGGNDSVFVLVIRAAMRKPSRPSAPNRRRNLDLVAVLADQDRIGRLNEGGEPVARCRLRSAWESVRESPCIASAHPIKVLGHVLAIRNPRDERSTLWTRVHKRDEQHSVG